MSRSFFTAQKGYFKIFYNFVCSLKRQFLKNFLKKFQKKKKENLNEKEEKN